MRGWYLQVSTELARFTMWGEGSAGIWPSRVASVIEFPPYSTWVTGSDSQWNAMETQDEISDPILTI